MSRLPFYKVDELADALGRNKVTLYRWRKAGTGPPWTKIGNEPVYPIAEFENWLSEQARANTKVG